MVLPDTNNSSTFAPKKKETAPHPPFRHPLPKGRGESYNFIIRMFNHTQVIGTLRNFFLARNTNFFLAPRGEDAHRAGEGLMVEWFIQEKIYGRI